MATSSLPSRTSPAGAPEPHDRAHTAYIDRQLNQTRRQVKIVDLAAAATLLVAGVLVYFLLLVVVDQWLMPLGFWGRLTSLTVLLGGAAWFVATRMLPLLVKQINPVYAAHTIEQSQPNLKNSLLNFLLFRKNPATVKDVVLRALEEQAAADLGHVEIETAVDRTPLIRLGYVLAGVLAVCAVYTVLSPKNPFTTVRRVMLPFADIQRPARVLIDEVTPGNKQVYHGQTLGVTVRLRGVGANDPVQLIYSTTDETTVDRKIIMTPRDGTATYVGVLPASEGGIQQDLVYRIKAGDAESSLYHVTVLPSPTMNVEEVVYQFPAYTGKTVERQARQGDLRALEGTRVTLHAVASQPIQEAFIEFDPGAEGEGKAATPHWSTKVDVNGNKATFAFTLGLMADRRTPAHKSYQLRFRTPEGNQNDQPILHAIEVLPDLPPELQIQAPQENAVEVPVNRTLDFAVRAIDPDFGLRSVNMKIAAGADRHQIAEEVLFQAPAVAAQQQRLTAKLSPARLRLRVGDELLVWFEAADTRTLPSGTPEPNVTRSKNVHVTVVPAVDTPQRDPQRPEKNAGREPNNEPNEGQPNGAPQNPENNQGNGQRQNGGQGGENQPPSGQNENGGPGQPNATPNNTPQNQGENNQQAEGSEAGGKSQNKQNGGAGGASGKQKGGESQGGEQQGNSGQNGGESSPGGGAGGNASNRGAGQGTQTADGGSPSGGKEPGEAGNESRPLNADGSQDADAIHEILQHREQAQQGGKGGQKSGQAQNAPRQAGNGEPSGEKSETPGQKNPGQSGEKGPESKPGEANADGQAGEKSDIKDPQVSDRKTGDAAGPEQNMPAGKGGQPQGGNEAGKEESKQAGGGEKKDEQGGLGDNGKSGNGLKGEEGGAPQSQGDNKQSRNNQLPDDRQGEEKGEAQSPSTSKHQSNAQGDQRGDQSGGGGKGGGQGAKQAGNDTAGSTSPGDEGSGAAKEQGNGETGSQAGTQQKSNERTGQGSNEKGNGSGASSQPKPGEPASGSEAKGNDSQQGEPGAKGATGEGQQSSKTGAGKQASNGVAGNEPGGNFKGEMSNDPARPLQDAPRGERKPPEIADVEYARKASDIALEYLKDQKDNPDPALLQKLGWTKEQLQDFVSRWQQMKDAAGQSGEKGKNARSELDAALRSLGLRPQGDKLHSGAEASDKLTGQRDTGGRTAPPPDYAEQYKAFLKGTARGEKKE